MQVKAKFAFLLLTLCTTTVAWAAGGSLTLIAEEESDQSPTIVRTEIWRGEPGGKKVPIRRTIDAGVGIVVDRSLVLTLADGPYAFRMIRGPEYRVITGTFTLEPSSLDDHTVQLPRMVNMLEKGWTSGDCLVVATADSLPLRMASEDLHLASTLGHVEAKPIPHRDKDDPIGHEPIWISTNAAHHNGLVVYGQSVNPPDTSPPAHSLPIEFAIAAKNASPDVKVAIENPFAWELPIWLASGKVDAVFLLGDWLRLDRKVTRVKDGRPPASGGFGGGQAIGRWGEEIYRNILDAGIRLPPLAGGGDDSAGTPVGYNRLYVAESQSKYQSPSSDTSSNDPGVQTVASQNEWWSAAWKGQSVATNGPMLRPKLDGKIPGHIFTANSGESLQLRAELSLSVRDPVEYLEVIHNNKVHYSARLDEFAKAGGVIPTLTAQESGWVIMRVVTLHEDHYRAAISAPWYIEFDGKSRVSKKSVAFFQEWMAQYENRLKTQTAENLQRHVPFVHASRRFWESKSAIAVD
ncbi:MAG: hypothetical protein WBD20_25495 [Pirellulaceae bacterium]